ncbi:hypothetical protein ACO0M4_30805 [Streptomyces sp. RGM 3693]|uniref:hypothetical protein n=1 Tax=Streptomyces sp. RGM 3693 TaxID=3413284 RepID=UPI003D2889F5
MDRSLVSVRAALVLLLAALTGVGAGMLSVLAGNGVVAGVLSGLAAAGGAVPVFNQAIAPDAAAGRPVVRKERAKGGSIRG